MMDNKCSLGPAFLLHRRRYRDSSLLLELFSQQYGRVAAISRGTLSARHSKSGLLQPFFPIFAGWSGKGEIKTVTGLEPRSAAIPLKGRALYCGFYLNELLMYLTQRHDPHTALFSLYENALYGLSGNADIQSVLRQFEIDMLSELGYQMELQRDVNSGEPIDPNAWYDYEIEAGPVRSDNPQGRAIQGATLLKMDRNEVLLDQEREEAKRLMRSVLNFHLDGRALKSKELFKGI